jgi:LacI family transcriptional regulator, galactose operon repressor
MRARSPSAKSALTIRDIARLAGVSAATVSRVVNRDSRVSTAKRGAVLAVIEQVHYQPSVVAQWLARGTSQAFGVLTEDLASEFYGLALKGIDAGLRNSGYQPIFANGAQPAEEDAAIELLLRNRVSAVIAVGFFREEKLRELAKKLPFVNVGPRIAGLEDRCAVADNLNGAYEATRHLIQLGHRRIAHIAGPSRHQHSADRVLGFNRALQEARIKPDPRLIVEGDFESASGARAIESLLRRRIQFTAVFASNDPMAYGAMHALFLRGLRVPRDVSIVGFDDRPQAAFTTPSLTTVRQPEIEMGAAAVAALLRELRGEPSALPRFATQLVVRESTARPPAPRRGRG